MSPLFEVMCPGHGGRMLLGPRAVESLRDTADGLVLAWRCHCGSRGELVTGTRRGSPRIAPAGVTAA